MSDEFPEQPGPARKAKIANSIGAAALVGVSVFGIYAISADDDPVAAQQSTVVTQNADPVDRGST